MNQRKGIQLGPGNQEKKNTGMRPRNQYKREPMERYKKKLRVWHCAALRSWYSVNSTIAFSRIDSLRLYLHFVKIEATPLRIPNRPSKQLSPITPNLSSPFLSSSYGARGKYILCCIWAFLQFPRRFLQMGIPTEYGMLSKVVALLAAELTSRLDLHLSTL